MAKALAYVSGTALAPGVSRNNRLYTSEAIGKAVRRAQQRITDGGRPIGMYTHHETSNTRELVGGITRIWQEDDGSARYVAAVADTKTGRDIASLVNPEGEEPAFLRGVSIRGNWVGGSRRERGPDGGLVETGSDLEIGRLDWTSEPGVHGAGVDSFRYAGTGDGESGERYAISESAPEALLETAITEETLPAAVPQPPEGVREALRALLGEAATVPMSKRDSGIKGGKGVPYADPGYQPDGKQRYELDTATHIRAAWAFISQAKNAKPYSAAQLKRIKGRIKAAAGKAGVTITAEDWVIAPALEVTEALVEYYGGDPESCGSYSLSATNGPTTVTVCSYGLDPADLHVVLAQACCAASAALCSIDPDMDGDIDVPGADAEDTESAEDPAALVTEAAPDSPAPVPVAANQGTEAPMQETTTTEAAATAPAATFTQADLDAAITRGIAQAEEARKARKAAKAAKGAPAETAHAPAAAVTETDDERISRIVEARIAAARPPEVTETEDERIARIVEARLVAEKQALTESGGGPSRKGLVTEHSAAAAASGEVAADLPMKNGAVLPMEEWSDTQRRAVGRELERYVLGSRASQ